MMEKQSTIDSRHLSTTFYLREQMVDKLTEDQRAGRSFCPSYVLPGLPIQYYYYYDYYRL